MAKCVVLTPLKAFKIAEIFSLQPNASVGPVALTELSEVQKQSKLVDIEAT